MGKSRLGMSRLVRGALVCAGLISYPAAAAPVYDGVTFEELESALGAGLDVQRGATEKGNKYLIAKGKNNIIFAHLIHCGADIRCEGVQYLSITLKKTSSSFINQFNGNYFYSKVTLDSEGEAVINVEHLALGGVTSDNLLYNALMLMVRTDDFNAKIDLQASLNAPISTPALSRNLSALRAQEGLGGLQANRPALHVDPKMIKAFIEQMEGVK